MGKRTVTGRKPSEPNIQQIPIRTKEVARIKAAFVKAAFGLRPKKIVLNKGTKRRARRATINWGAEDAKQQWRDNVTRRADELRKGMAK